MIDLEPDPLLRLPGVIRAAWWSRCRGCHAVIHGPGSSDLPCPCGESHFRGDVVGLADTASGRAWVCRACLAPDLSPTVPEPRAGETTLEVAR